VQEEGGTKKLWPLKVTVGERKLFIRAATKKERHTWFLALTSKIAHLNYLKDCDGANARPDTRVLNLFACDQCPVLHLDNRKLDKYAISALAKGLPGRDEMETISLKNCNLDDESFGILSEVIEKLSVKVFDLSDNRLTSQSVEKLIDGLVDNENVLELHFANNQLDDSVVPHLVKALEKHKLLSVVDLSGNNITDKGAAEFAHAVGANSNPIAKIQLSNNKIGAAGAGAIGEAINANKLITSVHLAGNQLGDSGAAAFAKGLKSNDSVSEVDVSNNDIGQAGAKALKDAFVENSNVALINLSGNDKLISGSGLGELINGPGLSFPQFSLARAGKK